MTGIREESLSPAEREKPQRESETPGTEDKGETQTPPLGSTGKKRATGLSNYEPWTTENAPPLAENGSNASAPEEIREALARGLGGPVDPRSSKWIAAVPDLLRQEATPEEIEQFPAWWKESGHTHPVTPRVVVNHLDTFRQERARIESLPHKKPGMEFDKFFALMGKRENDDDAGEVPKRAGMDPDEFHALVQEMKRARPDATPSEDG